jgi:hypothetical protein
MRESEVQLIAEIAQAWRQEIDRECDRVRAEREANPDLPDKACFTNRETEAMERRFPQATTAQWNLSLQIHDAAIAHGCFEKEENLPGNAASRTRTGR